MDVAAVLVCTYPAFTVILAVIFLKERVTRTRNISVLPCLLAIAMITA
ncbi:MAG TPA: hypothetical protein ENN91_05590 [Firmicutes bacterium]|nr:hypothetical protein [Bacillota bacterium]